MPNLNNPTGFRPLYVTSGGPIQTEIFKKVAGYGTAIFRGDLVNRVADGSIEASATPGTTLYTGVAIDYSPASTAATHQVVTDPDVIFVGQADGSLAEADMGLNANAILTAGNTLTKVSKHQINSATEDVTATLDLKLLRRLNVPDNEWGAYVRVEVRINKHRMAPGVAGV